MSGRSTLGVVIRQRRRELGWTQEELAERISADGEYVRQSEISRIENGKIELPRYERLVRIAAALDLPLGELLSRSGWAGSDRHFDDRDRVPGPTATGARSSDATTPKHNGTDQQTPRDAAIVTPRRVADGNHGESIAALRKALSTMHAESARLVRNRTLSSEIVGRITPSGPQPDQPMSETHPEPSET